MASTQSNLQPYGPGIPYYTIPDGNVLSIARRYPYRKLDGRTKIRLLKLFPESHESFASKVIGRKLHETDLFGTLLEVDLADLPSYECLSYTWGRSDPSCVLWLDENMIPISDNLDLALRCLQLEDQPRLLWVDFVCINQMDLTERKNQVQLMHDIYSSAKKVVAYLGPEADHSELIPQLFTKINSALRNTKNIENEALLEKMHCTPWALKLYGLPPSGDVLWEALRKFLSRPWFSRVWILQEALAARNLEILCGTWFTSAEYVFEILLCSIGHRFPGLNFSLESNKPWEQPNIRGCSQVVLMHELGICTWMFRSPEQEPKEWSLIEVLERSRYASASDPRDRVFALLNLCKEGKDGRFQPDYTETVRETFIRTAEFLIDSGQGAKVLLNAFLSDPSMNLPSWVPDWSFSNFPSENPALTASTYNLGAIPAAGGHISNLRLGKLQGHLLATAFRISEVESVACVHQYRYNRPFHMVKLVNEALQSLYSNRPQEHAKDQTCRLKPRSSIDSDTITNSEPQPASVPWYQVMVLLANVKNTLAFLPLRTIVMFIASYPLSMLAILWPNTVVQDSRRSEKESGHSSLKDRSDLPPLYLIMEEISRSLKRSSKYAEQDHDDIIWRTMVCSHQYKSDKESREDYTDSYKSFLEITRCQFEPGYLLEKIKRVIAMVESEAPPNSRKLPDKHSVLSFSQYFGDMNVGAESFNQKRDDFASICA
jgi:hypothetical protein